MRRGSVCVQHRERKRYSEGCTEISNKPQSQETEGTHLNGLSEDEEGHKEEEESVHKTCNHLSTDIPVEKNI